MNKNLVLKHDFIFYFLKKPFEDRTNEELVEIRNILEVFLCLIELPVLHLVHQHEISGVHRDVQVSIVGADWKEELCV